jgi:hypothetical protein
MATPAQPLNFETSDPAAPAGAINLYFQADAPTAPPTSVVRNASVYATYSYDTVIYFPVLQTSANQEIFRENCRHTKNYPAHFSGIIANASVISGGSCKTAASASTVFTIYQNGTAVGTITWAASAATPTLATTGSAALTFNVGDIITITGPATADATLSNWSVTLVCTRSS